MDNKRGEKGEKRCFDLFSTLIQAFGNDEIRARRGKEEQERNMLMIHTITTAFTNTYHHKRNIDDDESKHQENASSSSSSSRSLVESKRRRVVESDDEPIRAQPIRAIKPPVKKRKAPVKQKEPVRRESGVTPPGWLVELMGKKNGVDGKMVIEKVITKTDLKPDQGRFLIPFKQITEDDFLTKAELKILEKHRSKDGEKGVDRPKGVDVILLNSNDAEKECNANLRIWDMWTTSNYALCCGWNKFVRQNDLAANQTRRLWSFHSQDGTLYFVFDPLAVAQPSSSSSMDMVVISGDPFACEEASRRIMLYWTPKRSRATGVWILDPTSNLLEGSDLNRTPPPEDSEMDSDLEADQETHIRRHSKVVEDSSNLGSM
ncbi:unnamed protein product [Eruca vesicaria subsp. sativa]|uniref:TF-B3 domain-containing protein n=1 Tax=Eruca vesicaria subsp. sativa TaxID=29727 RepID=A0ABC8IMF3_ERUVS|nr:unnamed protein product [Eruca vesicaria subsp. sativa]